MATSLSYIIAYLGLYSRLLSVGVAIYRGRYLRGPVLVFALLQGFDLLMVVVSSLLTKQNNTYLSFISTGVDALVMSLMYASLMPTHWLRRLVAVFGLAFCALLLADYILWEGPLKRGNDYVAGLESFLVSGFLVVYLQRLLANQQIQTLRRHPMFLISFCLLTISLLTVPFYWIVPSLTNYSMTLVLRAYDVIFLAAFLTHVGYAIAFWYTKENSLLSVQFVRD